MSAPEKVPSTQGLFSAVVYGLGIECRHTCDGELQAEWTWQRHRGQSFGWMRVTLLRTGRLLAPWESTGGHAGRYRADPGQHLTAGGRAATGMCPGEVIANLDLPLCGDCAEIFSLGNQLVRTRVPFSILNPSSKAEGRLLSCCSLPRLEQPTPHSPEKLPWLGSHGLVCSWSLLLIRRLSCGSCIEADLCHIPSLRDQGQQGASEGDAEVKHTRQPCPLNLGGPKRQLGTAAEPCGLGALALSEDCCRLRPPLGVRYFWVLYLCFQALLMEPATTNLPG